MLETVRYWFLNGPRPVSEGHGTIDWMLGMSLWWRVWYPSIILSLALAEAYLVLDVAGPTLAVMIGVFSGVEAGWVAMLYGPRYDVTKNY